MKKMLILVAVLLLMVMTLTGCPAQDEPPVGTTPIPTNPPTQPHSHNYGPWNVTKAATCTESGSRSATCVCGDTVTEEIPATGHSYSEWTVTKEATCTEVGLRSSACACGETVTEEIPATGHNYGEWTVSKEATCTEAGVRSSTCACGEAMTEEIPATGHAFGEWSVSKEATCAEAGSRQRECACGEKETQSIDKLAHTEVADPAVAPTCTQSGLTEGKHCSVCGAVIVKQEKVAAKGHAFGDWSVTKEATCTENGTKTRTCSCGATEDEKIPATGHNYVDGTCACGSVLYAAELKVLEHVDLDTVYWSNGKIICGKSGSNYYVYNTNGKLVSGPYNGGIYCPNPDGYVIAYNYEKKVLETKYDEDLEEEYDVTLYTYHSYVIDSKGSIIMETVLEKKDQLWEIYYEGEEIVACNDGRIVTRSYHTYFMGRDRTDADLHFYDMSGNKIADVLDVHEFGNLINGKMITTNYGSVTVLDKNGKVVAIRDDLEFYGSATGIATGHHTAFFANDYVLIDLYYEAVLISEDLKTAYYLDCDYLCTKTNNGTLVFSKVNQNGKVSDAYYLIDVSKCATDAEGRVIPTLDAAVTKTPFKECTFSNYFGKVNDYALVLTEDDKVGYLSMDGKLVHTYDDASYFGGGYAIVLDGGEVYAINENFERVSNGLTGYDEIETCGAGVYVLHKGDQQYVAVLKP